MLRRDAGQSVSFCDGYRKRNFFHMGRGLLPFLAVMLLAAPQLAMAQGSLAVTVNPRTLEITEAEGEVATGDYTVVLDTAPSENVTITVVGAPTQDADNTADITVGSNARDATTTTDGMLALTFTTDTCPVDNNNPEGCWNRSQMVTVTVQDDADAVSETMTLTHTAKVGDDDVSVSNVSVRVTVRDTDMRGVTVSALEAQEPTNPEAGTDIHEAGTATYTVVLDTEPTAMVTVDVGGVSGELTVSPSRLFFMPGNYDTAQPVTVYAGEDLDADDDTATLTHTVRGGDYTGVAASPVSVTVDDNDDRGVTVDSTSLDIAAGARGTFAIMLISQPTGTVRITVTETADDFSVSPSRLSFSSSNWNRPQTVTVRVDSDFDINDSPVTLRNAIDTSSSSRDKNYDPEPPADGVEDVSVTISESTAAVRLSRSSMTIDEGRTAEYTVRLAANPGLDQSVSVSVNVPQDSGFEVNGSTTQSLTFLGPATGDASVADWNTAQPVTVTGPDDENAVQETVTITHTIGGAIVANGILRATVRESDTRGVTISRTSLEVTEGGTAKYNILLDSQPVGDAEDRVTVTIGGVSGDVTVSPSQLLFTDDNWFTAQEVEVTAATDGDGETDAPVTLSHTVRGGDYDRTSADSVRVTIKEIHTRGIIVDTTLDDAADAPPTTSLTIDEGKTGMYSVELESQPTGTVTVMVRGTSGDVSVSPSRLIFTTSSWDDAQMVEVKAGQDDDAEPDPVVTLTHVASGGGYSGVTSGTVTVTIEEDDSPGVRVTPTAITVTEGAAADSYTVVLTTEPAGTVTITLGGLADAKTESLAVNPTSLTFTRGNWKIPQVVTLRAAEDDNATDGNVTLTHTVTGGYDAVMPLNVSVTINDNDTARIVVSTTSIEMAQGTRRTYTVALGSRPAADGNGVVQDVEVQIAGDFAGVTVSPAPLTFTGDNWSTPRTIIVHAASNATPVVDEELRHTATGYTNTPTNVSLTVKSSTAPGVAINPTSLEITEGGSDSYTVVLTSRPTATVNVNVAGAADDVRVSRTRLSFSTSNWDREQTVTVSLAEDDDAVQDAAVTLTHTVTGADEYEDADPAVPISPVTVTLKENDKRGVTASPTSLTVAAGSSGTYRVGLTSEPLDAVTVTVNSPSDGVTVTGSPLVFIPANWNTQQPVTVNVAADAGKDEEQSFTLTHRVQGGDYSGLEGPTVALTIPVEGAPSAPTGLTAEAGDQSVTLTWGAPADNGGTAILRYEVRYQESGGSYSAWATVSGGATATSTTIGNLENAKSYEFQVRAVNTVAAGHAATASATLAESAPGAPANLTATGGDEQVALSWGAPADGGSQIIRYEYRYGAVGQTYGEWTTVSGGGSARSLTVTGLTNGTEYGFQVRAVNSIGEGPASEDTATPGRAPTMPTGLTAGVESETITVMWGMPADTGGSAITGYQVRYRMSGGAWRNWMAVEGGASATSYTIMGLTNGIGYEIAVRAVNGIGAGDAAMTEATPMEALVFAHFANGKSGEMTNISDLVLVNVETSAVNVAIYFYGKDGGMIPADSLVDMTGDMEPTGDGGVNVAIVGQGEATVSTNGEGELATGSVKVFATGRIGGVLRFDISMIGVAGVGASAPVSDAIFPVRRMEGGINTGVAIRNLDSEPTDVTCHLMQGGRRLSGPGVTGELPASGQVALFIDQMFGTAGTSDFSGSVRCMAAAGGMFTAVALEMDGPNQIFTTLPVVPVDEEAADDGESMLNFAHFANGDFGGFPTSSDLVFVNVANTAVAPAIYFYDRDGNMIDADTVVDVMMEGIDFADDGALTVMDEIPPLGEMTISTTGMGDDVVGSVRVVSDGPIGGVLRFVTSNIGVAGVGASEAVNAAIFPARYMENGINTGAAIRNLESERMTVNCKLMQGGRMVDEKDIPLAANAQNSQFITEVFDEIMDSGMSEFVGSVHCSAPEGMMFTGVALEMDFINRVFTTLPVVPVQ